MMTVLLIVHMVITVCLVGMVLLQRSEGGGLGIGGGGGGFMTTRGSANAMTKTTVYLATAFFITSISLSIVSGTQRGQATGSVIDSAQGVEQAPILVPSEAPAEDSLPEVPIGE